MTYHENGNINFYSPGTKDSHNPRHLLSALMRAVDRQATAKKRNLCYRFQMLSDYPLSFRVARSYGLLRIHFLTYLIVKKGVISIHRLIRNGY